MFLLWYSCCVFWCLTAWCSWWWSPLPPPNRMPSQSGCSPRSLRWEPGGGWSSLLASPCLQDTLLHYQLHQHHTCTEADFCEYTEIMYCICRCTGRYTDRAMHVVTMSTHVQAWNLAYVQVWTCSYTCSTHLYCTQQMFVHDVCCTYVLYVYVQYVNMKVTAQNA